MARGRAFARCALLALPPALMLGAGGLPGAWAGGPAPAASGPGGAPVGGHSPSRSAADPPSDAALLEFLGGVGSRDLRWLEYLAGADPARSAPAQAGTRDGADPPAQASGRKGQK